MTQVIRYPEARVLQGHRAGFASRVVADALDLGVAWLLGLSALVAAGVARYLLDGPPLRLPVLPNWLDGAAIAVATWPSAGRRPAGRRASSRPGCGWWIAPAAGSRWGVRSAGPCCVCCSRWGCCGCWPVGATPRCRTCWWGRPWSTTGPTIRPRKHPKGRWLPMGFPVDAGTWARQRGRAGLRPAAPAAPTGRRRTVTVEDPTTRCANSVIDAGGLDDFPLATLRGEHSLALTACPPAAHALSQPAAPDRILGPTGWGLLALTAAGVP
jgi:hypothetical protein